MPKRKQPQITITTDHAASSYGRPVCLVDGELADEPAGMRIALDHLRYTQKEFAAVCGKSHAMIEKYCQGTSRVPVEVWLVLRAELTGEGI